LRANALQVDQTARMALELTREIILYAARAGMEREPVNLLSLVTEMSGDLRRTLRKGLRFMLMKTDAAPVVKADRDQVRHVVRDLVTNAGDALADREKGVIRLGVGTTDCSRPFLDTTYIGRHLKPGPYCCIEVLDNAKGISPGVAERMFDPFFSTKLRGRGLGLPVITGILRAHKGTIRIDARPAGGTRARVFLPAAPV